MKRSVLFSSLFVVLSTSAIAQSSVNVYGSIDEGVTYVTNEGGNHAVLAGPVAVPDFIGFQGSEDLGGGMKALFRLETGYVSNTGANIVPADMFSRVAFVGLSGRDGTLTLGRHFDLTNDTLTQNSNGLLQFSYYLFHPASLDDTALTSVNNSVKYTTPSFGGLTFTVLYGLADTSTQPGRVFSVDAIYDRGPLRAAAVYSSWHDRTANLAAKLGYTSFLGQSLAGGKMFMATSTDISGLSGRYVLNSKLSLHGMLTHVSIDARLGSAEMNTAEAGADFQISPQNTVTLGGFVSSLTGTHYQEVGLGDIYALSKRTVVYVQATYQHANGSGDAAIPLLSPSNASGQAAFRIGVHHFF
ncbi:porin [Paraburkholderia sediminicola]|uniref:porin n=1 Tax=Paraburkholderia sediminicola TaxID=458836 RepID=UPI000EB2A3DC